MQGVLAHHLQGAPRPIHYDAQYLTTEKSMMDAMRLLGTPNNLNILSEQSFYDECNVGYTGLMSKPIEKDVSVCLMKKNWS